MKNNCDLVAYSKENTCIGRNVVKSYKDNDACKKADTKAYILCNSVYIH